MKRIIALLLCVCFIGSPLVSYAHWADSYLNDLKDKQILFGDEAGFRADDPLLRCEFAAMLNRAFSFHEKIAPSMPDVDKSKWYYDDFYTLCSAGILEGNSEGNLNPEQVITRAEAAVMLGRALQVSDAEGTPQNNEDIPDWAYGKVVALMELNILNGFPDGNFYGNHTLLRGEAASLLSKALNVFGFKEGSGTKENPYKIYNKDQFRFINQNPDSFYRLEADIDFSEDKFKGIGYDTPFSGEFDGNGHRIVLNSGENGENALFGKITEQGVVKNLYLVCPERRVSVAAENKGKIISCANTSFVYEKAEDSRSFGGIAQVNYGEILGCYNTSTIYTKEKGYNAGGICGINYGKISTSFNIGLTGPYCGGIVGENRGNVVNCYTTSGKVSNLNKGLQDKVYSGANPGSIFSQNGFVIENNRLVLENTPFFDNENFELFSGGDGSYKNPFRVSSGEQFLNINQIPDANYIQTEDIHVNGFIPVFKGTYNGNGFKIKSLHITDTFNDKAGLFIENRGIIERILVEDGYVHGTKQTAGLVADNFGTINMCAYSGEIIGSESAGICFSNMEGASIKKCAFSGRCYADLGAVGICGNNNGDISDVYAAADIRGKFVAGLVYNNYKNLSESYFNGELYGESASVVNVNYGFISDSYGLGEVTVLSDFGVCEGVASRTDEQMKFADGYPGLDFYRTWELDFSASYPYPTLKDVPHPISNDKQNVVEFSGGSGSVIDPFRIVTPDQLKNISKYPSANFIIMNDLDLADFPDFYIADSFYGILDGNNKTIMNLNLTVENMALFGENKGLIQNLYVKNSTIQGENSSSVCIENNGVVKGCLFNGKVNNGGAGLVLNNNKEISECYTEGYFKGEAVGGIALNNYGEITDSFSIADIKADKAFGISGGKTGLLTNCWFGGCIYSDDFEPISDSVYNNCFYLDFYGRNISNGKNLESPLDEKFRQKPWSVSFSQPILSGLPIPETLSVAPNGDGTANNPYQITEANDLRFLGMYKDKAFVLTKNIFADNTELLPIYNFSGVLDGNGKGIFDFTIDAKKGGLFETLTGVVKNLTLSNFSISGEEETGGITAINSGIIENCSVTSGRVGTSGASSGGISGINKGNGLIKNCHNGADVFSSEISGGVCGTNLGLIMLSNNTGGVVVSAGKQDASAGGIAGKSEGVIEKSFNNGRVFSYSETGLSISGGILGSGGSTVSYVYNTGEINAKAKQFAYTGGICGMADKFITVTNAYNTGFTNPTANMGVSGSSIAKVTKNGEIYGFVYEHTLSTPVGEGEINQQFIYAQPMDLMIREIGFEGFDFESVWDFSFDKKYYFPQLSGNEQDKITKEENQTDFAGGDGTLENPYKILTPEQLNNVRYHLGSTFMLLGDIDMTRYCRENPFMPIGDTVFSFFGLFIGNNFKITGLEFSGNDFGLFRENHGEIYNLFIESAKGVGSGGALCASNTGLIYNCAVSGEMDFSHDGMNINRGGLVGVNKGTGMIISSYNTCDINLNAQNSRAGGIAYENYGIISGTFNTGKISANATNLAVAGGISASNLGIISDCYSADHSLAESSIETSYAGGIVGTNNGTMVNCYYNSLSPEAKKAGSVVASNTGNITNCYYKGTDGCGDNRGVINTLVKCTDEELKSKDTFKDFDFQNMWIIDSSFKYPYPQFVEIAHRDNN